MYLTTKQAAERRGVSVQRIKQYIYDGRLPAEKHGRDYKLRVEDVDAVAVDEKYKGSDRDAKI